MATFTMQQLLNDLHRVLSTSIANIRLHKARSIGFKNELEFDKLISPNANNYLEGGQCLFPHLTTPATDIVYITVSTQDYARYIDFYKILSRLPIISNLFYIKVDPINSGNWTTVPYNIKNNSNQKVQVDIISPKFDIFKYDRTGFTASTTTDFRSLFGTTTPRVAKNKPDYMQYMSSYDLDEIAHIYANRCILDVLLIDKRKGMIDFDKIYFDGNNYHCIETKEKDPGNKQTYPTNQAKWFFGWDSRRITWYLYLRLALNLNTYYILREVNNQTSRNFVAWKQISLDNFLKSVDYLSELAGGGGGGTITAPYSAFANFNGINYI